MNGLPNLGCSTICVVHRSARRQTSSCEHQCVRRDFANHVAILLICFSWGIKCCLQIHVKDVPALVCGGARLGLQKVPALVSLQGKNPATAPPAPQRPVTQFLTRILRGSTVSNTSLSSDASPQETASDRLLSLLLLLPFTSSQ